MDKKWLYRYKNEKRREIIQEFVTWDNEDFINHILELRSVIDEMQLSEGEDQKNKSATKNTLTETNFKQEWSYPTKIAFFLNLHQKPLTSEELHRLMLKLDSHYKDYDTPRNNLTVTLSRTVKSGRIHKVKVPGIHNLYYVLPEWKDKSGNLNSAYQINSLFN